MADDPAPPAPAAAPPPPPPEDKVILVVDDKETTRTILMYNLKNEGYKTLSAEHGLQAIKVAVEQKVDMIILDVMMPKMDGFSVCEKLRSMEKTKLIPIVMCTAKSQEADVLQAFRAGANDYVVKPFSKATILEKVRKFIGEAPKPPPKKEPEKKEPEKKPDAPPPPH